MSDGTDPAKQLRACYPSFVSMQLSSSGLGINHQVVCVDIYGLVANVSVSCYLLKCDINVDLATSHAVRWRKDLSSSFTVKFSWFHYQVSVVVMPSPNFELLLKSIVRYNIVHMLYVCTSMRRPTGLIYCSNYSLVPPTIVLLCKVSGYDTADVLEISN